MATKRKAPAAPPTEGNAVQCNLTAPGYFPATDPRAGEYKPGELYRVPDDITAEKAAALVEGGGFVWATTAQEGDQ